MSDQCQILTVGQLLEGVRTVTETRNFKLQRYEVSTYDVKPAHCNCDVAEVQLNPVTETVDCKQLISHVMARGLAVHETAEECLSQSLWNLIQTLQNGDPFVEGKCNTGCTSVKHRAKAGSLWRFNSNGMLFHEEQVYISEEVSVRAEILKQHHDDALVRHFRVECTLELVACKYYWISMIKDVRAYIDLCDICQRVKVATHCPSGELQSLPQPGGLWQEVTMNFITDLPLSKHVRVNLDVDHRGMNN